MMISFDREETAVVANGVWQWDSMPPGYRILNDINDQRGKPIFADELLNYNGYVNRVGRCE